MNRSIPATASHAVRVDTPARPKLNASKSHDWGSGSTTRTLGRGTAENLAVECYRGVEQRLSLGANRRFRFERMSAGVRILVSAMALRFLSRCLLTFASGVTLTLRIVCRRRLGDLDAGELGRQGRRLENAFDADPRTGEIGDPNVRRQHRRARCAGPRDRLPIVACIGFLVLVSLGVLLPRLRLP